MDYVSKLSHDNTYIEQWKIQIPHYSENTNNNIDKCIYLMYLM